MLKGLQNGTANPAVAIRALVPEGQQQEAFKAYEEAQNMSKAKDNILTAFDKLANINTVGGRVTSPIQTAKQVAAIKDPLVAGLSKQTAGRFTEQDAKFLDGIFPAPTDDANTIKIKRAQVNKLVSEKMHFPMLEAYGLGGAIRGAYDSQGEKTIKMGPPVR